MTSTAKLTSAAADADHPAAPVAEAGPFVLNLCSSTTPMALAQTDLPELKRFTFFVSRRFEEGRERFRLHMGFFASQAEAEEWLNVVREIYPGAWAGEAPGKKLRARAAEAAAAQAQHAVGPQKTMTAPPAADATPPAPRVTKPQSAQPAAPPKVPTVVPTLHPPAPTPAAAAKPAAPAARASAQKPVATRAVAGRPVAAQSVAAQPVKGAAQPLATQPVKAPQAAAVQPAGTRPIATQPVVTQAARNPLQSALKRPPAAPQAPRTGVAAALRTPAQTPAAGLRPNAPARPVAGATTTSQPRTAGAADGAQRAVARAPAKAAPAKAAAPLAPAAPAKRTAVSAAVKSMPPAPSRPAPQPAQKPIFANSNVKEVLAALDSADPTGETRLMPAPVISDDAADDSTLTDTQVLRFLEIRREEDAAARAQQSLQADAAAESGISLLKPDDTGTRRALKAAVTRNEPVSFAVQLQWSVQPVELDKVPPLAIFSAYTLYSVEGSREGRKWYGLRLGFFNDAISAKQVAYYVRSEFISVAVVPVSPQERERATEDNQRFVETGTPRKRVETEDNEFKLIDAEEAQGAAPAVATAVPPAAAASPPQAPSQAAQTARSGSKSESAGKVGARERRTPQTLEETLEILGANELAIDNGRNNDELSDTGVRHLRVEFHKNTPFSRLLERLSERVRKA